MDPKIATYLQLNPYYVYGEDETPLQTQQKTEKYFALPLNLRLVCIETRTSEKIKEIVMDKYSLTTDKTKQVSRLIRLVFFGELPISDFINRIKVELQIDINIAQKIALDINKEIFHKVAPELRSLQKKFQQITPDEDRVLHTTPPKELPTLEEEYEETPDSYLEPVTEKSARPNPLVEGNVVNLKN